MDMKRDNHPVGWGVPYPSVVAVTTLKYNDSKRDEKGVEISAALGTRKASAR